MLKSTSGGNNDTELNELTVAPMRVPSLVMVVTTATPVGKRPSASLKLRSVNVIVLSLDALASRWLNCGTAVGSCPYLLTGYREARDLEHFAKWLSQKLR